MSKNIELNGQTYNGVSEVELPISGGTALFKDEDEITVPTGTKQITANGNGIDVTNYAAVDVNVQGGGDTNYAEFIITPETDTVNAQFPIAIPSDDFAMTIEALDEVVARESRNTITAATRTYIHSPGGTSIGYRRVDYIKPDGTADYSSTGGTWNSSTSTYSFTSQSFEAGVRYKFKVWKCYNEAEA